MTLVPCRIKDGSPRDSIGRLVSIAAKTGMNRQGWALDAKQFRAWCVQELKRVPGGLNGLVAHADGHFTSEKLLEGVEHGK